MTVDEQFDKIKEDMLSKATGVACGIPDYIAGLKDIIQNIEVAIEAAEGDLEREEEESMAADEDEEE